MVGALSWLSSFADAFSTRASAARVPAPKPTSSSCLERLEAGAALGMAVEAVAIPRYLSLVRLLALVLWPRVTFGGRQCCARRLVPAESGGSALAGLQMESKDAEAPERREPRPEAVNR